MNKRKVELAIIKMNNNICRCTNHANCDSATCEHKKDHFCFEDCREEKCAREGMSVRCV